MQNDDNSLMLNSVDNQTFMLAKELVGFSILKFS